MFNGEIGKVEEAKVWLSIMKQYFQIYNYSDELKAKMAIYNLTGKADIWWQHIKRVKGIKERYVTWKTFKRKYLSEKYYEEKAKEFYELRLGAMTMKELCSKFLSLLHYVRYIIDEKPKIQWFLSYFPIMFKEWIEYGNPKTLEEAMRKENLCYDQNKNKRESILAWKNQRKINF